MASKREFEAIDWVLFAGLLAVSAGIGIFYAIKDYVTKKSGDTSEFLMGGRNMGIVPVAISILVSFISAILIIGTPAEMYTAGTLFMLCIFGIVLSNILAAVLFVPLLYPLQLTSSFEYLERRFKSRAAKLTGNFIMVVQMVVYMGIASYAPSTALEAVTGFPTWATIVTIACVSTFYTFLGGMKAVVWTDVFQSVVMIAGLLAIVIKGVMEVGGFSTVWRTNEEWDRIVFLEFDPDPTVRHSVWSVVIGTGMGSLSIYGISQASVQRYCAVSSLQQAKKALLLNIIGVVLMYGLTGLAGIVMFAYYAKVGCDPLTDNQVENSNQLMPLFVMDVLNTPGIPGLFMSCLFSGALSSMSSSLNALSAVTWEDLLKPTLENRVTEATKTWIMRGLVAMYGGAAIGFAFLAKNLGGTVLQAAISFTSAAGGPLLGIFLLGALFPWANWKGCVVGGLLGLVLPMWISVGAYSLPAEEYSLEFPTDNCATGNTTTTTVSPLSTVEPTHHEVYQGLGLELLYTVSYLWYSSIGTATVVVVGLIVSFITGPMGIDETDPKYIIPIFDRIFCCLPEKMLRVLRCNLSFQDPKEIIREETDKDIYVPYREVTETTKLL